MDQPLIHATVNYPVDLVEDFMALLSATTQEEL
jgi:hypothetical protein